jgi:hypothetical protein
MVYQSTADDVQEAETKETPSSTEDAPTEESTEKTDGLLGLDKKDDDNNSDDNSKDDGLDPELYDTQTKQLREDVVLERIKSFKEKEANWEKQVKDLRRIVSKGKAPEDVQEYQSYKPDTKFEKYYNFDDEANTEVKEVINDIDLVSKDLGFNVEQNARVKDLINSVMEKAGIFDTRTQEQLELEREDWKREQLKKLGDNATNVIKETAEFIKNNNMFSEEEKESILRAADGDASLISGMYKLKKLIKGVGQVPIPGAETTGLADDYALAEEYNNPETSQSRRLEIIKLRQKAGRQGGLPVLKR